MELEHEITRVDAEHDLHVRVRWSLVVDDEGEATAVLEDTIVLPLDATAAAVEKAVRARGEEYVAPRYLTPRLPLAPDLAALVGRKGRIRPGRAR